MTSTFGQLLPWPNSIERLLPAEPLNTIYSLLHSACHDFSLPFPPFFRPLTLTVAAAFFSSFRLSTLSFSHRYDFFLWLQIYEVDVTAGSFVSLVMTSRSFNILSCLELNATETSCVRFFVFLLTQHSYHDNSEHSYNIAKA